MSSSNSHFAAAGDAARQKLQRESLNLEPADGAPIEEERIRFDRGQEQPATARQPRKMKAPDQRVVMFGAAALILVLGLGFVSWLRPSQSTSTALPTAVVANMNTQSDPSRILPTATPSDGRERLAQPVTAYDSPINQNRLGTIEAGRPINGQVARYGDQWVSLAIEGSGEVWIRAAEYGKPIAMSLPDYGPKQSQMAAQPAPAQSVAWPPQVVEQPAGKQSQTSEQSSQNAPAEQSPIPTVVDLASVYATPVSAGNTALDHAIDAQRAANGDPCAGPNPNMLCQKPTPVNLGDAYNH